MEKKITGDEPAMPTDHVITDHYGNVEGIMDKHWSGLTIRQHFAAMAMQGILSSINNDNANKYTVNDGYLHGETIAREALVCADALISALNSNKGE